MSEVSTTTADAVAPSDGEVTQIVLALEAAAGRHGPVPAERPSCEALREADRVRFALARLREQRQRANTGDDTERERLAITAQILVCTADRAMRVLESRATKNHPPADIASRQPFRWN